MYLNKLFNLINVIKNRFRKKSSNNSLNEYLDSEIYQELNNISFYSKGIKTEKQFKK